MDSEIRPDEEAFIVLLQALMTASSSAIVEIAFKLGYCLASSFSSTLGFFEISSLGISSLEIPVRRFGL